MFSALPSSILRPANRPVVVYSPIEAADYPAIVDFHRYSRVLTDVSILRDYTLAAVTGRYYEKLWDKHFSNQSSDQTIQAIKAEFNGKIIGFVRFGAIPSPSEECFRSYRAQNWGELHQLYTDPKLHGFGAGSSLFETAIKGLRQAGCNHMLINVLSGNGRARSFYEKNGAVLAHELVEHNERNGIVFDVPSVLYRRPLTSQHLPVLQCVPKP